MVFIVILEPLVKLCHDRFCIGPIMDIDIIPLEGLHEGFGHAVDSGLLMGVKQLMKPRSLAKAVVSLAV